MGTRGEMEAAWKVSPLRSAALEGLSQAEIKRRRY